MAKRSSSSDPWDVPIWFLVCAGSLAIAMAFAGWSIGLPDAHTGIARYEEALYRALSVNTLSDAYARTAGEGEVQNVVALRLLGVARWIGAVVFFLTLFKVVYRLFLENFLAWRCRNFWNDHIVIIGDRPIAYSIAEAAAAMEDAPKVVHFVPEGRETTRNGILTLDSNRDLESLLDLSAAHRARSLVFALEDNAESADMARATFQSRDFARAALEAAGSQELGDAQHQGPHIFVCVDDGWFEHREALNYNFDRPAADKKFTEAGVLDSVVELISESRCAARAVLAAHPLYAMGENHVQHILLVGFGAMGQALLTEICESQRTDPYRKQVISIIEPDASKWTRFKRQCPEWEEVFDGHFHSVRLDQPDADLSDLFKRMDKHPVTAAYVATGEDLDPPIAAAQLKQLIAWQIEDKTLERGRVAFPIFTCVRGGGTTEESAAPGTLAPGEMPIQAFGTWDEIVQASRILEKEPDLAAYRVHSVHNDLYSQTPPTNWSQVREVNRYSSRSAAAFVPTLLHAAGFDLTPWIEASGRMPSPNTLPSLGADRSLAEDLTERVLLARLEHIRWCAERRLRGFRHNAVRDDGAKHHPDLVGFDALPLKSRIYNLKYILTLSQRLQSEGSDVVIPPREGAPRALVRPTDLALLKEAGMLPATGRAAKKELSDAHV